MLYGENSLPLAHTHKNARAFSSTPSRSPTRPTPSAPPIRRGLYTTLPLQTKCRSSTGLYSVRYSEASSHLAKHSMLGSVALRQTSCEQDKTDAQGADNTSMDGWMDQHMDGREHEWGCSHAQLRGVLLCVARDPFVVCCQDIRSMIPSRTSSSSRTDTKVVHYERVVTVGLPRD